MVCLRVCLLLVPLVMWGQIRVPVSLSASFVQKITTPAHKTVRYTGTLRLNRSRAFRWVYRKPQQREICGDGDRVQVVDHDLEQVTVYRVGSLLDLMQLLKRAKPYRGRLYTARYHGTTYTLQTNPLGQIEQIAYVDKMDNVINLHFHDIRYREQPFSPAQLRCLIPSHYDTLKG